MKNLGGFVRDRLISGLLFLLPFLVVLLVGRALLQFIAKIVRPLALRIPSAGLTGPVADYVVAALVLLIVAFLVGVLASTSWVRRMEDGIQRFATERIPGFALFKAFLQAPDDSNVKVLFVTLDEAWLFGFLMEELPDGHLAVFVPGVPSPTSGSLYFFTEDQVRRTDISVRHAVRCLTRLGVGSARLVNGRLPAGA